MKSFIKFLFVFFAMVLSFIVEPQILHAQDVQVVNYIQNASPETVEIVSNNLLGGEIYVSQENSNQNFFGNTSQALVFNNDDEFYLKNKSLMSGCFIHTLSTNLKEVQQIRAP